MINIRSAIIWLLSIACLLSQTLYAASLTAKESEIIDLIASQSKSQQLFLQHLVDINSGTSNIAGVKQIIKLVSQQLRQLGFEVSLVNEPAAMHRAPTLIAKRDGTSGKRLLLIGHLDTVFPVSSSFKKYSAKKNSAKGPGVVDDKGGVAVMLYALKALHAAHALDQVSITIVLTGDEEDSGKPTQISRKPLMDAAKHCDVALDFEPAMNLETATIGRRGITQWTVNSHGNQSHSATIFQKDVGAGAIFEMARILDAMRHDLQDITYLTFNPGMAAGGTKLHIDVKTSEASVFGKENVVASIAIVKGDMRFMDETQREEIKQKMRSIVSQNQLPGTRSDIAFVDGIPAMAPTLANQSLLQEYSRVSEDLGLGAVKAFDPALRGAGDISYVAAIVPANLAGLGPVGYGTHSVIESIELPSLSIQTRRAAILVYRLTHSVVE